MTVLTVSITYIGCFLTGYREVKNEIFRGGKSYYIYFVPIQRFCVRIFSSLSITDMNNSCASHF